MIRKGLAVAGITAGLLAAGAGAAFAGTTPTSGVQGTITVPSTITLSLNETQFTASGAPGATVPASYADGGPFQATVTTDDAGYTLNAFMLDKGVNPNGSSLNTWDEVDAFTNGGTTLQTVKTIPDQNFTDNTVQFPAVGNGVANQTAPATFNGTFIPVNSSTAMSAPTGDALTQTVSVLIPANAPGGASYSGTIDYAAIG